MPQRPHAQEKSHSFSRQRRAVVASHAVVRDIDVENCAPGMCTPLQPARRTYRAHAEPSPTRRKRRIQPLRRLRRSRAHAAAGHNTAHARLRARVPEKASLDSSRKLQLAVRESSERTEQYSRQTSGAKRVRFCSPVEFREHPERIGSSYSRPERLQLDHWDWRADGTLSGTIPKPQTRARLVDVAYDQNRILNLSALLSAPPESFAPPRERPREANVQLVNDIVSFATSWWRKSGDRPGAEEYIVVHCTSGRCYALGTPSVEQSERIEAANKLQAGARGSFGRELARERRRALEPERSSDPETPGNPRTPLQKLRRWSFPSFNTILNKVHLGHRHESCDPESLMRLVDGTSTKARPRLKAHGHASLGPRPPRLSHRPRARSKSMGDVTGAL